MRRYLFEAEYEDGFVYTATQKDESIYDKKRNAFFDIMNNLTNDHGKMVRWSLLPQGGTRRLDIDFSKFPDNVKPIYYMKRERDFKMAADGVKWSGEARDVAYGFGYEYTGADGQQVKEVVEVE